jgi:hypothetical protein
LPATEAQRLLAEAATGDNTGRNSGGQLQYWLQAAAVSGNSSSLTRGNIGDLSSEKVSF